MSAQASLPLLKIDALSKSFSGAKIIDDVSFEVHPSEVIGIIGRSGAGKSTLLRCLNMLEPPDSGHIWLDNEEIGFYGAQRKPVGRHRLAQQRAAMAMEPRVILFDEPTSALDPESVGEVLAVISELAASGTTMMVVTHEMRFALQVCSRLLLLDNGRLVDEAMPQEIWSRPENAQIRHFMTLSGVTAEDRV